MGKKIGGLSPKEIRRLQGAYLQRPGEDEFDVMFRTSEWSMGLFVFWVAAVRGSRWAANGVRRLLGLCRLPMSRPEAVGSSGSAQSLLRLPSPLKALPPPRDTDL